MVGDARGEAGKNRGAAEKARGMGCGGARKLFACMLGINDIHMEGVRGAGAAVSRTGRHRARRCGEKQGCPRKSEGGWPGGRRGSRLHGCRVRRVVTRSG